MTVIGFDKVQGKYGYWICRCICGETVSRIGVTLKGPGNHMCDSCAKKALSHPTHGDTGTRLHHLWINMRWRCRSDPRYCNTVGRRVCSEWEHYDVFKDWALANGYDDSKSIDRIDNDGPYAPWNCRWADAKVQANNTRANHKLTANGKTQNVTEWANELGVPAPTLFSRIRTGATDDEIVNTPFIKHAKDIEYRGEVHSISEWGRILEIRAGTISARLRSGWPVELALTVKPDSQNRLREDMYGEKVVKLR